MFDSQPWTKHSSVSMVKWHVIYHCRKFWCGFEKVACLCEDVLVLMYKRLPRTTYLDKIANCFLECGIFFEMWCFKWLILQPFCVKNLQGRLWIHVYKHVWVSCQLFKRPIRHFILQAVYGRGSKMLKIFMAIIDQLSEDYEIYMPASIPFSLTETFAFIVHQSWNSWDASVLRA